VLRVLFGFKNMNTFYRLPKEPLRPPHSLVKELIGVRRTWKSSLAVFGLLAGLSAPIIGSLLTVITWFRDPAWHSLHLHHVATSFFVLTIPLLVLGAHCLDLLDEDKKWRHPSSGYLSEER